MPNTKSTVNVKINTKVKEEAVTLLANMGIDQTTAIEMYYRKIIAVKALPFRPEPIQSNSEQLLSAVKSKSIPNIKLHADKNGYAVVDTDKHPELLEWVAEG